MEEKVKATSPVFSAGDKVAVSENAMKDLVGPYKNTGTVSMVNGGRVLVAHDSTDKDMKAENMGRWHQSVDLTKQK
jgi:hypothetical protein